MWGSKKRKLAQELLLLCPEAKAEGLTTAQLSGRLYMARKNTLEKMCHALMEQAKKEGVWLELVPRVWKREYV